MKGITATYDPNVNAAYVRFGEGEIDRTEEVEPGILIDFATSGYMLKGNLPIGIELLNAKPRPRLAVVAAKYRFADKLDDIYAALDMATGMQVGGATLGTCRASV